MAQDIFGALLTQAQARNRAWLSGALDAMAWLVAIYTTSWSVTALQGHNAALKGAVLGAVTVANVVGSYSGTILGKRYVKVVLADNAPAAVPVVKLHTPLTRRHPSL